MKRTYTLFLILAMMSTQSVAALLHDESLDGDAGLWWNTAEYLGPASNGDYVLGHVSHGGGSVPIDWDGWSFDLDGTVDSITIDILSGTIKNYWQIYDSANNELDETPNWVFTQHVFSTIGFNGLFKLGNNSINSLSNYDYRITFGPAVNPVPLPAALLMFAPALLGFLGLRRKRQT